MEEVPLCSTGAITDKNRVAFVRRRAHIVASSVHWLKPMYDYSFESNRSLGSALIDPSHHNSLSFYLRRLDLGTVQVSI